MWSQPPHRCREWVAAEMLLRPEIIELEVGTGLALRQFVQPTTMENKMNKKNKLQAIDLESLEAVSGGDWLDSAVAGIEGGGKWLGGLIGGTAGGAAGSAGGPVGTVAGGAAGGAAGSYVGGKVAKGVSSVGSSIGTGIGNAIYGNGR